jgi:hypothetical protein
MLFRDANNFIGVEFGQSSIKRLSVGEGRKDEPRKTKI